MVEFDDDLLPTPNLVRSPFLTFWDSLQYKHNQICILNKKIYILKKPLANGKDEARILFYDWQTWYYTKEYDLREISSRESYTSVWKHNREGKQHFFER